MYFLFRRQPHFSSNFGHLSQLGPIGKFATVCNQFNLVWKTSTWRKWKYQPPEFTDRKGNGIAKKSTFEWQTSVTKIQVYKSVNNFMWYFFDTTGKRFFESRDIYFFVWKYWSISSSVRNPITVGQTLRAASGSSFLVRKNPNVTKKNFEPIFLFCGKNHFKNIQNTNNAIWS